MVEVTGISPKRLRYDVLRFLLSEDWVEKVGDDTFQLRRQYRPVAREIWAVEAKMKNWFEGMCQAKRYQHFAHRAYLAIFASYRDRVQDEMLREQNIGLIAVSPGIATVLFHPHRLEPRSEELFLMTNERVWEYLQVAC